MTKQKKRQIIKDIKTQENKKTFLQNKKNS